MSSSTASRALRRHALSKPAWRCSAPVTGSGRLPALAEASRQSRGMVTSGLKSLLQISDEVSDAIANKKPLVALESTIYTHGAMGKELAQEHEDLIRSHGGIPAIIAIVDGVPKVGVSPKEIVRMIETEGTVKVSRRDVSYLVGMVS
jgi:hypothetical protein